MALRIIFMGTPEFAVPTLERLAGDGHTLLAVTQPPRPAGRGLVARPSPVACSADRLGIEVIERATLKGEETVAPLADFEPDLLVVAAFGLILRRRVLDLPRLMPVNLHPSLLPRHRGVAPIPWTILCGDRETAVTTIRMDAGIDTGDLLLVERTEVGPRENTVTLTGRLAVLGAGLVSETVRAAERGDLEPRPQGSQGITYAPRLTKEHGYLDWRQRAIALDRRVRAMSGWPGARARLGTDVVEILSADAVPGEPAGEEPGTVVTIDEHGMEVAAGAGRLRLTEIKPAGKRSMSPAAFARGRGIRVGARWTSLPGAVDVGAAGPVDAGTQTPGAADVGRGSQKP